MMFMCELAQTHVHLGGNLLGEGEWNNRRWWKHTSSKSLVAKADLFKKVGVLDVLRFLCFFFGREISALQALPGQKLDFFYRFPRQAKFGKSRIVQEVFGKGLCRGIITRRGFTLI